MIAAARAIQIRPARNRFMGAKKLRLSRLENEMRFQGLVSCALHDRAQEYSFIFTTIIGQMSMRLTKGWYDLRHFQAEPALSSVSVAPWL